LAEELVEAEVFEVLAAFGLAHLRTDGGRVIRVNRETVGMAFDSVRSGQRYLCVFSMPYNRVERCMLIDSS